MTHGGGMQTPRRMCSIHHVVEVGPSAPYSSYPTLARLLLLVLMLLFGVLHKIPMTFHRGIVLNTLNSYTRV